MSRELLQQALEALQSDGYGVHIMLKANIKAELEKPDHEPFGYFDECFNSFSKNRSDWTDKGNPKPLYEHPSSSEIERLHNLINDIRCAAIDCFPNQAIACDGVLNLRIYNYKKLADAINKATQGEMNKS